MLVLNPRFVLLAAFCSLATLSLSSRWGVGAAAIQSRPFDHNHCQNVTFDRPSAQYVLPLPLQSKAKQFKRDDDTPDRVTCKLRKHSSPAEVARRSVLVPDNHGSEYVVSHSRRPAPQGRRRPKSRTHSKRAQDAMVGYVALVSPVYGSSTGRQIATLFADPKGPEGSGTWTLYASETNQTQFQLVNTLGSMESTSDDLIPVTLEMGALGETRTCATYNSNPPQDESDTQDENMTMGPCTDRATPEAGRQSQIFLYNGTSGTLEPTWSPGGDGANTEAASSPVNQNSTSSSNATATSSSVQAAATSLANREDTPQNVRKQSSTVTLVFTPEKEMVADVGTQQNSTTTGTTITMTKTVTVFSVESTSAGASSSTSNTAPKVTATSSALNVQLVGAPIPSSNAAKATTVGPASLSTSSSTATGSIDAAAVASRIAASASASSASAAASSSSYMNSASLSSTQAAQRRANGRLTAFDSKVTSVSTEPYTWMFKAEER